VFVHPALIPLRTAWRWVRPSAILVSLNCIYGLFQCDNCHMVSQDDPSVCVPKCGGGPCDLNTGQCTGCPFPNQNPVANCEVRRMM
jgi:hypothetical protein